MTLVRRDGRRGLPAALADDRIEVVADLSTALHNGVDIGVVAGPATGHLAAALAVTEQGAAAVLVEKPLSTDDDELDEWLRPGLAGRVVLGYHLRFGDLLPELRRLVGSGAIGRPRSFALSVGQHLSLWRPGTDPARSVSARRELGGGVLLELSHELDALRYLFDREVVEVTGTDLRTDGAPTDGHVETVADLELAMSDGLCGTVHLDMISEAPVRSWRIDGSDGSLHADLLAGTILLTRTDGVTETVLTAAPGERERAEAALIEHLLAVASGAELPRCTITDGVRVLEIVAAARRCAVEHRPVRVRAVDSEGTR